ncbi:MAG: hypothetical protein JJT76_00390 [Clostridiaceae bacterium]|nr:hypothetical protein [Clostridiaceae bacterium]
MFCKCFCPGKLNKYKKDVEIEHNGKTYKFSDVSIQKCNNTDCKDGYMSREMWEHIKDVVGDDFQDIGTYNLSRKVFRAFIEQYNLDHNKEEQRNESDF